MPGRERHPLRGTRERLVEPLMRQHYYHQDMRGSWSLKAVLPTVAPSLDYEDLGEDVEPGSSRRRAIVVSNVLDEYAWIREHYPDHRVTLQMLCWFPDGFFDMLRIEAEDGDVRELYFALGRRSGKRD